MSLTTSKNPMIPLVNPPDNDLVACCSVSCADLTPWFAEPLPPDQAIDLLNLSRSCQQAAYRQGQSCFRGQLGEVVGRWWLDSSMEVMDRLFLGLAKIAKGEVEQALVDLVHGQLLLSRKLPEGQEYLQSGFTRARNLLPAADFFEVLHRHELLAYLPVIPLGAPPEGLAGLSLEAAVIRRLKGTTANLEPYSRF